MTSTENENPIEQVRARLDGGRKWLKSDWGVEDGPQCLNGAAYSAGAFELVMDGVIADAVVEQFPDRIGSDVGHWATLRFNNHPDTVWADVDVVLDKAARAWDEAVR